MEFINLYESFIGHLIDINAENIKSDFSNNIITFSIDDINYSVKIEKNK